MSTSVDGQNAPRSRPARWYLRRTARRVRAALLRPVFWDRHRDPRYAVAVCGSARSGTTWLGDLLAQGMRARIVFEPFHPVAVPEASEFGLMPFREPEDQDPALLAYCRAVFSGEIRGPWVDRQARRILPQGRVVKCVRANLFAAWLRRHLPEVPIALIVRHPAAVALSRMEAGWSASMDLDALLGNARMVERFLVEEEVWARTLSTEEERHALVWAIQQRVAFAQHDPSTGARVLFYEDLVRDPAIVLDDLYRRLGRSARKLPTRTLRRPSSTARTGNVSSGEGTPPRWVRRLGEDGAARVRGVVERMGLDWVYGSSHDPRPSARERLGVLDRVPESPASVAEANPPLAPIARAAER